MGDDSPGENTAGNRAGMFQMGPQRHLWFQCHPPKQHHQGCVRLLRGLGGKNGAVQTERRKEGMGYSEDERWEQY